jgi:hypothetical protein
MTNKEEFDSIIEKIMKKEKKLSFSSFRPFFKSPKHFYSNQMEKKEETKAMTEGTMFHMAILEPERFESTYWVFDDSEKVAEIGGGNPRVTAVYKNWKAEIFAKNEGKEPITKELKNTLVFIREYLQKNSATKDLLFGEGENEVDCEFEYENLLFHGRIDRIGKDFIVDLKKVADASFDKNRWNIRDSFLDVQADMYCMAKGIKTYYLIFVDLECNVCVVKFDEATLNSAWEKFKTGVEGFLTCIETDSFLSSYEFYNGGYITI